jgi:hypothetical protein
MMPPKIQDAFVNATEQESHLMSTSMSVTWEWFDSWGAAIDDYLPRYSAAGTVQGFVAVDVPFMIPVVEFSEGEFFKVLGKEQNVVLFRPREWRGSGPTKIPFAQPNYLTPKAMAKELSGYPRGTVSAIYLTSDGGANLNSFYELVGELGEHVEVGFGNVPLLTLCGD